MSGWREAAELLRAPRVGPFLLGRALASVGIWMERIGLGWLVWDATGSAGWVGVLAFARLMPAAVFGPWGGVLADRLGALPVLRASFGAATALSLLLAAQVVAGGAGLWLLLLLGTLSGVLQSVANGPMKAALSEVSPRHLLPTAIPVGSVTFNLAAFAGPALAGALLAGPGAAPVFQGAALAPALFVAVLWRLPSVKGGPRAGGPALQAFAEAAGVAARDPVIAPLVLMHLAFAAPAARDRPPARGGRRPVRRRPRDAGRAHRRDGRRGAGRRPLAHLAQRRAGPRAAHPLGLGPGLAGGGGARPCADRGPRAGLHGRPRRRPGGARRGQQHSGPDGGRGPHTAGA